MEEKITKLWERYTNGLAYQNALGITTQIPQNIDFYEGRQWAETTTKTKNLPRPVVNIVKMIVRNKKAGILGSKVVLSFNSDKDKIRSDKITEFNNYTEKEMGADEIRNRFVDSAIKKGSGFLYYYWDAEADGKKGNYDGCLKAEIIDPLNIFFSNPQETDEQKQKWILIATRMDVAAAREYADDSVREYVVADDDEGTKYNDQHEQSDSDLCTVLTCFFKNKNGEVYYVRATKSVVLHKPLPLAPNPKSVKLKEVEEEAEDDESYVTDDGYIVESPAETEAHDEVDKHDKNEYKAMLYPFVAYSYEEREKSIYGISEIEGIIPNQKTLNFLLAMQTLAVQNQAWGKLIVKEGALGKGQQVTNTPGEMLVDYHKGPGDGIKRLQEQPFSTMPIQLVDNFITSTRMATGSTEVVTGEQVSANQSGAAIAQLQSQALKPIEELRGRYWRACERAGKVVE